MAPAWVPLQILRAPSRCPTKLMFKTKSVHTKIEAQDGLRILVARGQGRGLARERYDIWMANLGPSEQLRDAILAGKIRWAEYRRRYLKELRESAEIDRRNQRIKNHGQKFTLRLLQHLAQKETVTLLCHCAEDERHCHRHLLKALLEKKPRVILSEAQRSRRTPECVEKGSTACPSWVENISTESSTLLGMTPAIRAPDRPH
jgi:uncharacterized protein YeaO (DUF488 family)